MLVKILDFSSKIKFLEHSSLYLWQYSPILTSLNNCIHFLNLFWKYSKHLSTKVYASIDKKNLIEIHNFISWNV